jgi:hypothetical protein
MYGSGSNVWLTGRFGRNPDWELLRKNGASGMLAGGTNLKDEALLNKSPTGSLFDDP